MGWKAVQVVDPFEAAAPRAAEEQARLRVVERGREGFFAQLGAGWIVVLALLAVGAVLLAGLVWQPMMSLN